MKVLFCLLGCLWLTGCAFNRTPLTVDEQDEQQARMREFLKESSPRYMNQQPKVTPEFNKTFRTTRHKEIVEEEILED